MAMVMDGKEKYQCIAEENKMLLTEEQLRNLISNIIMKENIILEYKRVDREECPYEKVFQQVRKAKLYDEQMPQINWDDFAEKLNVEKDYETYREDFYPTYYSNFDDWFLRKMSPDCMERCIQKSIQGQVVSPCQGTVRKQVLSGDITLKKSIIALDDLLGILNSPSLLQISLRKTDYHRIHSPCDGIIESVEVFEQGELFKDSEACTIIDIASTVGKVTLMPIGEWTVQTFVTDVMVGQPVSKLEELGYFYFGSQVIIGYDGPYEKLVNADDKKIGRAHV